MQTRVRDRIVDAREHVVLARELVERTDGPQEPLVLRAWALEQHRDVSAFEVGHDLAERATWRSASTAAAAMPISTATIRSNATVATAVSTRTSASDRVETSSDRTLRTSTMRTAVTISTPANAAMGMLATRSAPTSTT